jgi:hypothetical protein
VVKVDGLVQAAHQDHHILVVVVAVVEQMGTMVEMVVVD